MVMATLCLARGPALLPPRGACRTPAHPQIPKGRMIAIQGRLKIRNWMTQAGEKRTSTSVRTQLTRMHLLLHE
jgi:hypothetical protein